MSDDFYKEFRDAMREKRASHGRPCPECVRKLPKASPSILLPQQRCRIHNYRDPRPRTEENSYLTEAL